MSSAAADPEAVAERYLRLAYSYANRMKGVYRVALERHPDLDADFDSAAHDALLALALRYGDLTISPEKYLSVMVRYHALKMLKARRPLGYREHEWLGREPDVASLERLAPDVDSLECLAGYGFTFADARDDPDTDESGPPAAPFFEELLSHATAKEAEVLRLIYADGLTVYAAARRLGVTYNAAKGRHESGKRRVGAAVRAAVSAAEGRAPGSFRIRITA